MIDVSVVIPTFRRPVALLEALRSALRQTDVSLEVIVVDDSPEGSAREIVESEHDPRLHYLRHDPPSGGKPALVRNAGWPLARGRIVHFLDDDDRVADHYYRAAVDTFAANPDCGVVFGRIEPFAAEESAALARERAYFDKATRRARFASRVRSKHWLATTLLFNPTLLVNSACMIRRECIPALQGYDVQLGLNEDVDFFCRAIRRFGFRFLDQVVLHYRVSADSLIHGRADDSQLIASYRRMQGIYRERHGIAEFLAMKLFARTIMRVI